MVFCVLLILFIPRDITIFPFCFLYNFKTISNDNVWNTSRVQSDWWLYQKKFTMTSIYRPDKLVIGNDLEKNVDLVCVKVLIFASPVRALLKNCSNIMSCEFTAPEISITSTQYCRRQIMISLVTTRAELALM